MKMICSWCGKDLGEKDGEGVEGVSHGVCEECLEKFLAEVNNKLTDTHTGSSKANNDC